MPILPVLKIKYRHDIVYLFSTTLTLAEAMGTKMYFPEDDAPPGRNPADTNT